MQTVPFYEKYFFILSSITLTLYIVSISGEILNPLLAASLFALILKPVSSFIEKFIPSRLVSSLLSVSFILLILLVISAVFSGYITSIVNDLLNMDDRLNATLDKLQNWGNDFFGIAPPKQIEYLKNATASSIKNSLGSLKSTLQITTSIISELILFILSLFFILYYRKHLINFIYEVFNHQYTVKINKIFYNIEKILQHYIIGLCIVMGIIAVLNTVGLLVLNVPHAMAFGVIAAVLTLIPYVGIILGALLPIVFTLLTKDSFWYPIAVAGLFTFVQFLEGNFITPNIQSNRLNINPFATMLALFIGGMLLGIMGVLFAIPLLAIINTIAKEKRELKPLCYLIGDKVEK